MLIQTNLAVIITIPAIVIPNRIGGVMVEGCPDVVYHVVLRCWSEDPNDRSTFGFLYNFFDTVIVINEGNQEDDPCSTGSNLFNDDNSSAGSYNDTVPKRKNSDLEEDMLQKQKSNNRKSER
jgi:hypothetical protein